MRNAILAIIDYILGFIALALFSFMAFGRGPPEFDTNRRKLLIHIGRIARIATTGGLFGCLWVVFSASLRPAALSAARSAW
jgi:hypothetical protein